MAVRYEETQDTIRLTQTRGGLRKTAWAILVLGVLGNAMIFFIGSRHIPTTLACHHARASCSLTEGRHTLEMSLASIEGVSTEDDAVVVRRSEMPRLYAFCRSRDEATHAEMLAVASGSRAPPQADLDFGA